MAAFGGKLRLPWDRKVLWIEMAASFMEQDFSVEIRKDGDAAVIIVAPSEDMIPEKTEKVDRKNAVDTGKLLALHSAGWAVKDIASELRCSEQTVRNKLKEVEG